MPPQGVIAAYLAVLAAIAIASVARASDVDKGERLARNQCAHCHVVAPHQRAEVADAPPFEDIARKGGYNVDQVRRLLLSPHKKMNFVVTPPEADDIAAYMSTLAK